MISGLVLAAGAGRRLGRPKAELLVWGERLVDQAVRVLSDGGCDEVVVVGRTVELSVPGARAVLNAEADSGMSSSLRRGLVEVSGDGCVIVLVDEIGLESDDVAAVIRTHQDTGRSVVTRRGGMRSRPVLIARHDFEQVMLSAVGDRGAAPFIDAHADELAYVDRASELQDIDTPEDLLRITGG